MSHKVTLEDRDALALQEADALLAEDDGRDSTRAGGNHFKADLQALEEEESLPRPASATAAVRPESLASSFPAPSSPLRTRAARPARGRWQCRPVQGSSELAVCALESLG